jgi:hypothetical protein
MCFRLSSSGLVDFMRAINYEPIPVAAWSKAWVCDRWLAGIACSNPAGGGGEHGCLSRVSVVCCQVEVSASGWSPIHRNHTDCVVSECAREVSNRKSSHRPTTGRSATGKKLINKLSLSCHFRCFRSGVSEDSVLLVDTTSQSHRIPVFWGNVELSKKSSSATFRPLKMVTPCCLETSGSDTQWHGVMPQKNRNPLLEV